MPFTAYAKPCGEPITAATVAWGVRSVHNNGRRKAQGVASPNVTKNLKKVK